MNRRPKDNKPDRSWIAKWFAVTVLLAGSGTLVVRSVVGDGTNAPEPGGPVAKAEVSRVYSGHKIKLESEQHLNYAGIRAPFQGEPFFEDAKARNVELVEGKKIRLRFDEAEPTDGETLNGYAFADGEFVNELLVREGLAYVRLTTTNQRFAKELLDAQLAARRGRKGLWHEPAPARESVYVADPKYGNFHRPGCEETPNIKPERRKKFKSRRNAFDKGFAPCKKCKP